MTFPVDLHTHSYYSPDASCSPQELCASAKMAGLRGVVITDHNTTRHFEESRVAAEQAGLLTCQGIEVTASYRESDMHVLGYAAHFDVDLLCEGLQKTIEGYRERSRAIAQKITELGLAHIDIDLLDSTSKVGHVTKPALAQEIARQREMPYPDALRLVERGGPAYIPYGQWVLHSEAAVDLITKAGGKAVLAHPGDIFLSRSSLPMIERWQALEEMIALLVHHGLYGIEVYYPSHSPEVIARLLVLAKRFSLVITGGSDWHGELFTPDRMLGMGGMETGDFLNRFLRE